MMGTVSLTARVSGVTRNLTLISASLVAVGREDQYEQPWLPLRGRPLFALLLVVLAEHIDTTQTLAWKLDMRIERGR